MMRGIKFVVLLAVYFGVMYGVLFLTVHATAPNPAQYTDQGAYNIAAYNAGNAAAAVAILVGVVMFLCLAPRVGYRWLDALFIVVPIVGFYILMKVLWRWASLPADRYWIAGTDEVPMALVSPAGWYTDTTRRYKWRYFDGAVWSTHVTDRQGFQAEDPLEPCAGVDR